MSYTVFARKYRPQTFDDVIGQEHITRTLKNAIEQKRLAHAYIFVGPRGTGKTSTARILAKSLNCQSAPAPTILPCGTCDSCKEIAAGTSLDVLEFDAASNTQVDKVRELIIDNVKYMPSRGRFKVYIVDEVHMLSTSSFNALLKTLEEPPEHVKFFFATTDVQKVPTTILSRCQRFDLKRIPTGLIASHLLEIARREKIELTSEAAEAVARGAEGGMRDAESMLDQLVAFCSEKIDEADVLSVFGLTAQQTVSDLCEELIGGNTSAALGIIHAQAEAGRDLSRLLSDLITHFRNLLVAQADPAGVADELSEAAVQTLVEQASRISIEKTLELIEQFAAAEQRMKWAPNKRMHFEIGAIRAVQTLRQATLTEVLDTLAAMRGGDGAPPVERPMKPAAPMRPAAAAPKTPAAKPKAPPAAAPAKSSEPVAKIEPTEAAPARAAAIEPATETPIAEPPPRIPSSPAEAAAPVESEPAAPSEIWRAVVAAVRKRRPLIAGWVEAGTLLSVEGGNALVGFPPSQALASEYCGQASNRPLIESALAEAAGTSLTLKCQVRDGLAVPEAAAQPEVQPQRDPADVFKDDPLIRKALEIFRAEIQPA